MTITSQYIKEYFSSEKKRPFLIAGPCSAETEQQVMSVAESLLPLQPQLFRAGIWKPRTRPGTFEGAGTDGLKWLQQVKKSFGLKTTVEVANAQHVALALQHDVDVLWIGARSTVNPFTVQEIADAMKGVDIPVIIKNPINPDLNLWIGAIERIYNSGISKIMVVHRGFSSWSKGEYRNDPMWEIPIELKRQYPDLFIICDPSHITGKRENIFSVSQKAMDLNFDGLMIETHTDPDKAWSDREQQITPLQLSELLSKLVIRETTINDYIFNSTLDELRKAIDDIDLRLVQILKERMEIVEQIGGMKKDSNITILQPERWAEIFHTRTDWADRLGLTPEMVDQIFQLLHTESIRKQTEVMNRNEETIPITRMLS